MWPDKNRQMSFKVAQNDFTRKMNDFESLQKLTKNGEDWGKLIVAKAFKKLPKVQNIAQSGHTGYNYVKFLIVQKSSHKVHRKVLFWQINNTKVVLSRSRSLSRSVKMPVSNFK